MDEVKKRFLAFSSHVICFGMALNLSYIFLCAYLNGYHVNVYVNNYDEAWFELILFSVTLLFCLFGLWYAWHFLKKAMEVKKK